jgi:MFS transporter, DHA1 family, multidrug resistance protein
MVLDIVRDSTFGVIINYLSTGRIFPYRDQLPGYKIPDHYFLQHPTQTDPLSTTTTRAPTPKPLQTNVENASEKSLVENSGDPAYHPSLGFSDPHLVCWDGEDDPDNPMYVPNCSNSSISRKFSLDC